MAVNYADGFMFGCCFTRLPPQRVQRRPEPDGLRFFSYRLVWPSVLA